jgi:hypothetical protein
MKKKLQARKLRPLNGHEQRAANAFLRSVVFTYDSRWILEAQTIEHGKACKPHFKRAWTSTYMGPQERSAYIGMFTQETVYKLQARWYIEVRAWFSDGKGGVYAEEGQIVSDYGKINDAMPALEKLRDELKGAGNHKHFLYYEWRAEVYKDQPLYETLDEKGAA